MESELGLTGAFFGLIEQGWSITDTEGKGPRGPLGPEAQFAEWFVGTLDAERASRERWTAAEFNDVGAHYFENAGKTLPRCITDDELLRVRKRRAELFAQWAELAPGASLVLEFAANRLSHR